MELVSLRELCKIVGVSRRSIQCYEKEGLMSYTGKNKYGYLLYDKNMQERAKLIRFMHEVGFKLKEIGALIDSSQEEVKEALEKRLPELEREEKRLRNLIDEVRRYIKYINS